MDNIYREAIKHFGEENQKRMCIEEMSELTKELCKNSRGMDNMDAIAEEIADVEIMISQMKVMFDNDRNVMQWKYRKLKRLFNLLQEEN